MILCPHRGKSSPDALDKRDIEKAFSLVELSIVLVILGLLTGGILAGQSLIRAAELRSVTVDFNKYQSAAMSFRDKYFALPGDMPNAVRFWGAQAGGTADGKDATCAALTTSSTGTATCNGDGDGTIDYDNSVDSPYEGFRAWQQLANAGLIEGQYAGVGFGSDQNFYTQRVNTPGSKISNGVWQIGYYSTFLWSPVSSGHFISFGSIAGSFTGRWHNEILSPEEAWNIDTKMDDGKPYTGKMVDIKSDSGYLYTPNCTTNETSSAEYALTTSGAQCLAMFAAGF
jgi:prepilin-type N-terminal cleavage/methylation domain-containing protein